MKPLLKSLLNALQQKVASLPVITSPTTITALSLATSPPAVLSPATSLPITLSSVTLSPITLSQLSQLSISLLKVGVLSGIMALATLTTGCSDPHEDGIDPNAKVDIEPTPPLIPGQSVTGTDTEIKSVPSLNDTNELNVEQNASNNLSNDLSKNLAADPANVVVLEPIVLEPTDTQESTDTPSLSNSKAATESIVVTEDSVDNESGEQ